MILAANRKRDRPGRKIKQIAVKREIAQRQLKLARVMQGNIDSVPRRRRLAGQRSRTSCIISDSLIQEGVKRRGRIRIHESLSQPGLANNVSRLNFFIVPGITETRFPVPGLEVIAKFAHLTAKSHIKENVVKGGGRISVTLFQSTITNAGKHRGSGKGLAVRRNSRVCYRERIKRILDWHTYAAWSKGGACYGAVEWIGHKRRRRQSRTEIGTGILEVRKQGEVLVANVAREGSIVSLSVSPRNRRRQGREIESRKVPIRIRNVAGVSRIVLWACRRVRYRLIELWLQAEASYLARKTRAPKIKSPKGLRIPVAGKFTVAAEDVGPIVEIGNHHDVGLVISHARFEPGLQLTRVVGRTHVRVPHTAPDLKATELVDQKDVEHTRHRLGAVNSRGAILEDVDVIDHREGIEVDVHTETLPLQGDALSIDEDQRLFGQQTTQARDDSAVTAVGDVLVNGRARLRRQFVEQIGCIAHTQILNVLRSIGVHRIRSGFFRGRNVRTGHDHSLDLRSAWRCTRGSPRRRWRRRLSKCARHEN